MKDNRSVHNRTPHPIAPHTHTSAEQQASASSYHVQPPPSVEIIHVYYTGRQCPAVGVGPIVYRYVKKMKTILKLAGWLIGTIEDVRFSV